MFFRTLTTTLVCTTIIAVQHSPTVGQVARGISRQAQQITVRIDGEQEGSGIIIAKSGNIYTVLTNWHVIDESGAYSVITVDGQRYTVDYTRVQQLQNLDLALVEFRSSASYEVARIGNSDQLVSGEEIYFAGYPRELKAEKKRYYTFQAVHINRILSEPINQGYAVVYDGEALPGMSGGPVLNSFGHVIGIHGEGGVHNRTGATSLYAIPINSAQSQLPNIDVAPIIIPVNNADRIGRPKPIEPDPNTPSVCSGYEC